MAVKGYLRGHLIYWHDKHKKWIFWETDNDVDFYNDIPPCNLCGRVFRLGDFDSCLGYLPGVDSACCGHGIKDQAFIRFKNGIVVRGFDVIQKN